MAEFHNRRNLRVGRFIIILIAGGGGGGGLKAKALCMVEECKIPSTDFKICILTKREYCAQS